MSNSYKNVSILIENDSAPKFIRMGWAKALKYCGYNVNILDPRKESIHDHFNRCEPEIFIGTTYGIDRPTLKCLQARPNTKVGLFGSCCGWIESQIDRKEYPLDIASSEEQSKVYKLTESNYTAVFIHHTPKVCEERTMNGWKGQCNAFGSVMNGSDLFTFLGGKPVDKFLCDISFVGGYWPYKSRNLDKILGKLCEDKRLNIKIFGNGKWPYGQYLGLIEDAQMKDLFASSQICLNISEPHSTDLGFDIIERVFKVPTCNSLMISDRVQEIEDMDYPIPTYETIDDIMYSLDECKCNPKKRIETIQEQKKWVLDGHTYFHRVRDIFNLLDLSNEGEYVMAKYEEFRRTCNV